MQSDMRRCLEQVDVAGIRQLWSTVAPHLPQPKSDADALVCIHSARTRADSIALRLREYSHAWLTERGYPSGLPDALRPVVISEGVGISVNARSPLLRPAVKIIQGAMSDAVADAYAEGRTDPTFVKARMNEARETSIRSLFG